MATVSTPKPATTPARRSSPIPKAAPIVESVPAIPGLPVLGNLFEFRRDRLSLHEQAATLGPIARFQVAHIPIYSVSDADVAHEILVTHAAVMAKSAGLQFLAPVLGEGLLSAEGDVHKRHRKLLAPAFAPKRLAGYGDVMVEETRRTVDSWRGGKQVDLAHEIMEMTLSIAGRTLFGAEVRGDAEAVGRGLELGMRSALDAMGSPLQLPYAFPLPRNLRMRRAVKMLDEVVYRLIADGRRRGGDAGDVLSMLLVAADEDGGLSDQQVRDEVMTLLLAGHETTANALAWTWYELGRNPAALDRLRAEVDQAIGTRPVTVDDLPAMPWNLAVIEEAMRLHPPAYQTGRETTEPVDIGGHHFPAHSILAINILGIHRRADYFPAPLAFLPERMLADAKKARPRHHYMPFGAGPRVCIGSHFALLEAQLCLATMVQRATIQTLVTHVEPEPLITLRPRGGLPALVGARTTASA